ncbi:hypothetical protein HAV22_00480 [Massilia sp. TW-1]|uniref:FecR protein domain-containing protein n=1 Tax=Telluria antibiotica TaxID=2717319 RepID=A0ABX0P5K6_9BURK|nr:DUF6600 domain-containing protein [Telluria antibiotica]NIA52127.1 hypothetical protein [Telluria antibiotica]
MTARKTTWMAGLGLALAASAAPALAQDPPARVGRIAYVAGPVSFSPAGAADWAQAPLNRPLVAGDRLWTDAGARDEAQFGSAVARMDAGTLLTVLAADDRTTQLQVSQGRVDVHVPRLAPGETVEVDTPNLAFVARQPGDYRLAVAPDGSTTDVTVLRGAGDAYGDGSALALAPGQGYRFGGQDLNNYVLLQPVPPDDFDRWAMGRDQRYARAVARRYVPQGVVGAEDLDDYGSWRQVPDYGTVWVPDRAPQGWAPYHAGHWAWIDPWGWTWIDDQPYGYAVSHYGRWVRTPDTWAWVPAPVQARPVYAPALVAFVGAVLAVGGRSDPGVGWFPLAPHEPYRPPYHASPTYITNVNVTNTVIQQTNIVNNVTNIRYVNRTVPGAIVAMPAQQFAQAVPTARAAMLLPPGVARAAPVLAAPQARPLPQSRLGMPLAGRLPPAPVQQRVAVARALPRAAFVSGAALAGAAAAHAAAPARHGAPLAVHGPVPPLRVLRPAIGKPVVPQPARGPVPGVDAAGRQFAQGGRPGTPPAGPAASHGPQGLVGMPPAAGRGPVPVPGPHGQQFAGRMPAAAGSGPVAEQGPHGPRPGAATPWAAGRVPVPAPGPHGPLPTAGTHPATGPGLAAVQGRHGLQSASGMPVVAGPRGPAGAPAQGGVAAHGASSTAVTMAGQPEVRPGQPGGAAVPGRPGLASGAPTHGPREAAMVAPHGATPLGPARPDVPHPAVPQIPPPARPPERLVQHGPGRDALAARGMNRQAQAPAVPMAAADRHGFPPPQTASVPAGHEAPRAPALPPAHAASEPAPRPQAVAPAPHEPPHPVPQPPQRPHEPPRPAPQPPHEPPHPHPAPPAHGAEKGADKGADHGHQHGDQGGH